MGFINLDPIHPYLSVLFFNLLYLSSLFAKITVLEFKVLVDMISTLTLFILGVALIFIFTLFIIYRTAVNELQNLHYLPRVSEPREFLAEDRTKCHADHVGHGLDRQTTAAVGVLKAIHVGGRFVLNLHNWFDHRISFNNCILHVHCPWDCMWYFF